MSPGATMERVYGALKERIRQGQFGWGEHIDPTRLSRDLAASVTPVRDALHRLAGEGLIGSESPSGFYMPILTEAMLRDRYRWSAQILALVLSTASAERMQAELSGSDDTHDTAQAAARFFRQLCFASDNREHHEAIARVNDRLHPARQAELDVLDDLLHELETLRDLGRRGEVQAMRSAVRDYHRRRLRHVVPLMAQLHPRDKI